MPQELALLRVGLSSEKVRKIASRLGVTLKPVIPPPPDTRTWIPYGEWINRVAESEGVGPAAIYKRIARGSIKKPPIRRDGYRTIFVHVEPTEKAA